MKIVLGKHFFQVFPCWWLTNIDLWPTILYVFKFWSKIEILAKNRNFDHKSKFWPKIEMSMKTPKFGQKSKFLSKMFSEKRKSGSAIMFCYRIPLLSSILTPASTGAEAISRDPILIFFSFAKKLNSPRNSEHLNALAEVEYISPCKHVFI